MVGCTSLSPEGHGKFPDSIDGGPEPVVSVEGFARPCVTVVKVNCMFPVNGQASTKELIPSNAALGGKGLRECNFDGVFWWLPRWGCDAGALEPTVEAVADKVDHEEGRLLAFKVLSEGFHSRVTSGGAVFAGATQDVVGCFAEKSTLEASVVHTVVIFG